MDFKKCPFCGGVPKLYIKTEPVTATNWDIYAIVECPECAINVMLKDRVIPHIDGRISFAAVQTIAEQLAAMWNRRSE